MGSAYLALGYECNHRCSCCPCTAKDKQNPPLSFDEVKKSVDSMIQNQHVDHVVISGGEPTIHNNFLEIIALLCGKGLSISLLSNGDKFSDPALVGKLCGAVGSAKFSVTTTLHSHCAELHEKANASPGSFRRSISGMHNLMNNGINVIVKHCITGVNYKGLREFGKFVYDEFPEKASLQISGLDFCGTSVDTSENIVSFSAVTPYLESLLDAIHEFSDAGKNRYIYCTNIPLCAVDPYYWRFFITKHRNKYYSYCSPSNDKNHFIKDVPLDRNNFSIKCDKCIVSSLCEGVYASVFDVLGDEWVSPFIEEQENQQ